MLDPDGSEPVLEAMWPLVSWGLVEAWSRNKLLSPRDFDRLGRSVSEARKLTFYIAKFCLELESAFGVSLDSGAARIFGPPHNRVDWPEVFLLMPFTTVPKPVYDDHIRGVAQALRLRAGRADDFFINGSVMADIWSAINSAKIIIADCTGRNPNVFYEVGLAHSLGKDTILISQELNDVPFDLRHMRVITYEYTPRGMKSFEATLKKTIITLLKGGPMRA